MSHAEELSVTDNIDLDRLYAILEKSHQLNAALRDLSHRRGEAFARLRECEATLARQQKAEQKADRRQGLVAGDVRHDPIAMLERDVTRARERHHRLQSEERDAEARWQKHARLAERCDRYIRANTDSATSSTTSRRATP